MTTVGSHSTSGREKGGTKEGKDGADELKISPNQEFQSLQPFLGYDFLIIQK
jgi:hypothetical protein